MTRRKGYADSNRRQALRHRSSHIWGFGDCDVSINFELSAKVSELSEGRECCVRNPKLPGTRIETLGVDVGAHRFVLAVIPSHCAFGRPVALCLCLLRRVLLHVVLVVGPPTVRWARRLLMREMRSWSERRSHRPC